MAGDWIKMRTDLWLLTPTRRRELFRRRLLRKHYGWTTEALQEWQAHLARRAGVRL